MPSLTPNTIIIKDPWGAVIDNTMIADATITPGMLIEEQADGKLNPHSGAGLNAAPFFALEDPTSGAAVSVATKAIDTDYAAADSVVAAHLRAGAKIFGFLVASGSAVVIGSFLESAGDGTLRLLATDAATDDTQRSSVVAKATQAITPGGSKTRCEMEII